MPREKQSILYHDPIKMNKSAYHFTTERQLNDSFYQEIKSFWKKNAHETPFFGEYHKSIHAVSVKTDNKRAIVFSLGRTETALKYREVAYDLSQQGFDLYFIDHRGQGGSERLGKDKYQGHVEHFENYSADLHTYIKSLDLKKHYKQSYLISHSMGGLISCRYLQKYNHPFESVVLLSPMISINFGLMPSRVAQFLTGLFSKVDSWFFAEPCYVFGGKGYRHKHFKKNDLTSSFVRFHLAAKMTETCSKTQLGDPSMNWVYESIKAGNSAMRNAKKIEVPILVVQAANDCVVSLTAQSEFYQQLDHRFPHQFLSIQGAKHELLEERDEYRHATLVAALDFFKSV